MVGDPLWRGVVSEGFILWHVQLVRNFVGEGLSEGSRLWGVPSGGGWNVGVKPVGGGVRSFKGLC